MIRKTLFGVFLLSLFLIGGCGYRFVEPTSQRIANPALAKYHTFSLSYIEGDQEGSLTSALIHALSSQGPWKYLENEGDLIVKVTLMGTRNEEIAYTYSYQSNQVNKWLVPNENRLSTLAKVELVESCTQKRLLGPEMISSDVYYDYDPEFNQDNLVRFSLAQYNFQEIASRTAKSPLERRLATQIANYLTQAW